jgi:hypothetical protein
MTLCARELKESPTNSAAEGEYDNSQTWLKAASQYEAQGDLYRALYTYRLARTVSPGDRGIDRHLRRVESEIKARATNLLKQAERAEQRGQISFARNCYLDVLALQPGHPEAFAALRRQDKSHALIVQQNRHRRTKTSMDYAGSHKKLHQGSQQSKKHAIKINGSTNKPIAHSVQHIDKKKPVEHNLNQAETSYQAQKLDQALIYLNLAERASKGNKQQLTAVKDVRKTYAEALYNRGVISYRSEPDKALHYWRYALKFDPEDNKSRLRIDSLSGR